MTANTEHLQIQGKLFEENFFCRTLRWLFLSFKSFTKVLTSYCTASIRDCVLLPLTLKKTRLAIYVYIWLPRKSACVLKHKQTLPEQAVYAIWNTTISKIVHPSLSKDMKGPMQIKRGKCYSLMLLCLKINCIRTK